MLSSATLPEEDENYEIASPLLGGRNNHFNIEEHEHNHGEPQSPPRGDGAQTTTPGGSAAATGSMDPRIIVRHPVLRAVAIRCATMSCAADALPTIFYYIVTEGKMTAMATAGVYTLFVCLWIPFWLLSFVVTEWGVYALAVLTVFGIGRSVLRMIAFPGASCRVRREIEGAFAKYSVQMLLAAMETIGEVALVLLQATGSPEEVAQLGNHHRRGRLTELPTLWRRAELYKNRVIAVYLQVLQSLYDQAVPNNNSSAGGSAYLSKHGNNRLIGDIGNVADLTVGREAFSLSPYKPSTVLSF